MSAALRLVAALAVAGTAISVATFFTVQEREDYALLHAESFDLGGGFRISASALGNAGADADAVGTDGAPVEIAAGNPAARTALVKGHWTYAVTVQESAVASVATGSYRVDATMNGVPLGCVVLGQATREDAAVEGAVVTFDVGTALDAAPLFFVRVTPLSGECAGGIEHHDVTLGTKPSAFTNADGTADNPTVTAPLDKTVRFTLKRTDGGVHNIGIFQGPAALDPLSPGWSQNVDSSRSETTLAFRAPAAGTYEYRCQYHWTQGMKGTLTITS